MKTLTLDDINRARSLLESTILREIREFERLTGFTVGSTIKWSRGLEGGERDRIEVEITK